MKSGDKALEIFRELAGERAERLVATHYLSDVNSRIASAITRSSGTPDFLKADHIGFHLVDWQAEAAFIVALSLYPERFTDEEIRDGIESFMLHAPAHVMAAARLSGVPIADLTSDEKA